MDGCSGFAPDHLAATIRNIQLVCGKQKTAATQMDRCSRIPATKITEPVLAGSCGLPRLSSSPDLRLSSFVQPSQDHSQ